MTWNIQPMKATMVTAEPGDATRYVFSVVKDGDLIYVTKLNGSPFAETFRDYELRELHREAPEIVGATYDNYQIAASNNDYIANTIFPLAAERDQNAWTFLAAALAALKVTT